MPALDGTFVGTPIWNDLSTTDIEKAMSFYGALFGWTGVNTGSDFGNYHICSKGDAPVAGMMQKTPDLGEMPDVWTVYLTTGDAAKTVEAIRGAGGQVLFGPDDVPGSGIMAVAIDPSGAMFGVWEAREFAGFGVNNEPNAPVWHELMTRDFPAATAFYQAVFGVELADMDGAGTAYKTINAGGSERAGIMDSANGQLPDGVPSNWLVYYGVYDADVTVDRALELGGSVMVPASDTPYGRFAVLADPFGAVFAIMGVDAE